MMKYKFKFNFDSSLISELKSLFDLRFSEVCDNRNDMLKWVGDVFTEETLNYNNFDKDKCNCVYNSAGANIMSNFWFPPTYADKIRMLLNLQENKSPIVIGIRVFPNMNIPVHLDKISNNKARLSLVVSGRDGLVYAGSDNNIKGIFSVYGLNTFVMYPAEIPHGATAGAETYDLIQIELDD